MGDGALVPVETTALVSADRVISDSTRDRIDRSVPPNTGRAYERQQRLFREWCEARGRTALPATPETLTEFVNHLCDDNLAPASIQQAVSAVRTMHALSGYKGEPGTEGVGRVMLTYKRDRSANGERQRQAPPIDYKKLREIVAAIPVHTLRGKRDAAILVLGYSMFARRSELSGLHLSDVREVEHGLEVFIRRAKTDKTGEGQDAKLLRQNHADVDPVLVWRRWVDALAAKGVTDGRLLRKIDRHGNLGDAISDHTINRVVKAAALAAGFRDPDSFSGHSLRAGAATEAHARGAQPQAICRAGRWIDGSTSAAKYARAGDEWAHHPLGDPRRA